MTTFLPAALIALGVLALTAFTRGWRKYEAHVPHPEFRKRWAKLPKVESGTKKRF